MSERAYDQDPRTFISIPGFEEGDTPLAERAPLDSTEAQAVRDGGRLFAQPLYTSEHRWLLANLPMPHLVRLQQAMDEVGFSKKMVIGSLDDATIENFTELLGVANRRGEDWQTTLGRLSTIAADGGDGVEGEEELPEFQRETYLAPDPVSMAEKVRQMFRDELKWEPRPDEIDALVRELGGLDRLRHEQEQELAELRFNSQYRDEGEAPEEVQMIDPSARFRQKFEQKYGGEIEHLEGVQELADQRDALQGNVAAMDRHVGR